MLRQCVRCDKPFEAKNSAKACSPTCSLAIVVDRNRRKRRGEIIAKHCTVCSKPLDPSYSGNKCSDACRLAHSRTSGRERAARYRKEKPKNQNIMPCVVCSTPFHALKTTVTCSKKCRYENNAKNFAAWHAANPGYRVQHKEHFNKLQRLRYSENAEAKRQYANEWYKANSNAVLDQIKDRHAANPERRRARWRAWSRENPDKARTKNRNRHARKRAAPGKHTAEDVIAILRAQSHCCAYCRTRLKKGRTTHIDHIVALAAGGSNDRRNLQALCSTCNCRKSAKDPIEFAQERGLLL